MASFPPFSELECHISSTELKVDSKDKAILFIRFQLNFWIGCQKSVIYVRFSLKTTNWFKPKSKRTWICVYTRPEVVTLNINADSSSTFCLEAMV